MKISKRWKGIASGVLNLVLIAGPLVYLGIYPNLHQEFSSYTESLFFSLLDGNYTTIGQAKDAYEAGEPDVAKITLKQYYINRPVDSHYEIFSINLTEETIRADNAIQRIFTHHGKTLQLPNYPNSDTTIVNGREIPNTNWHKNPYPEDDEWIWQISRWEWIHNFARVYLGYQALGNQTQADFYARECIDLLTDFMMKEPVGSSYTWRTIDSALRVQTLYGLGDVLKNSTYFTPEFCYLYLRFIVDHGRFLIDFHKTSYNWAFIESEGILSVCAYFPEFLPTQEWEMEACETLSAIVQTKSYPDGDPREHALNYHMIATSYVRDCLHLAEIYSHLKASDTLQTDLLKKYLFLLHNTIQENYSATYGDSRMKYLQRDIGEGRDLFPKNPELSYFDSNRITTGLVPPNLSVFFSNIGIYISRSAWNDSDALFSYFDGGNHGEFYNQYQLFGSIQLYAYGRRLLLDPGISSYTFDTYSNYFRQSYSHRVVLINGNLQIRAKPYATQRTAGYLRSITRASTKEYRKLLDREVNFCDFQENISIDTLGKFSNSSDLKRYWAVSDFWHGKDKAFTLLWHLPYTNIPIWNNAINLSPQLISGGF